MLSIEWDSAKPMLNFVGCNPSLADETKNDPTIERLQRRATELGFGWLMVTNIFAFKSPYPRDLKVAMRKGVDIIGVDGNGKTNDEWIKSAANAAHSILCGWGRHGDMFDRGADVRKLLQDAVPEKLFYLKLCHNGQPQHPLYIPYETKLAPWKTSDTRSSVVSR